MNIGKRAILRTILCLLLMGFMQTASAQRFYNLTADEVTIDSVLPRFSHSVPLSGNFEDSVYTTSILYPEFIDMSPTDSKKYAAITTDPLPILPEIEQNLVLDRKKGALEISFCPLVHRDGKDQILVSFMLKVEGKPVKRALRVSSARRATAASSRYADHSVLASGNWAKIRVPSTGVYQLTESLIEKAGFTDLSKIRVYGYGGALQNETLVGSELQELDDLKPVDICLVNGKRLFYAQGPVSWSSNTATERTRNPYSDYGYYFITQADDATSTIDATTFINSFYPSAASYHSLHEIDDYAWFEGGRNLFESSPINNGASKTYTLASPNSSSTSGTISVALTSGTAAAATVELNGTAIGSVALTWGSTSTESYDHGKEKVLTVDVSNLQASNEIKITTTSGGPIRLDYISITTTDAAPAPDLENGTFSTPEYVENITNQDRHADEAVDMVILIPTSQKLLAQAQRLKTFHEQNDGLRVRIVSANELYNEFSSGTPDANAYRRYLKMLYDRAESDDDMPKYLLLFGDCMWDNRMNTSALQSLNADDYLLCFESENSFNEVYCYVDDGFFCLLDDGEGANPQTTDKLDMAVGRFPVTTAAEAKIMVDKTIAYVNNKNAGAWQNTLVFMGDDGNDNVHMRDVNAVADDIAEKYAGYLVKKVMWDAYTRETSSTGYSYPEVTTILKQYQNNGALIMDYAGHGSETQLSHESVLTRADFAAFKNTNLPLWVTASCNIMPFDGTVENIGETAVLNENGGAVAFFGTTRTVYVNYNRVINQEFMEQVLSLQDGKPITLGEAQRLTKNALISSGKDRTTNKLQYSLLGDPAISLHLPTLTAVIDSINGVAVSSSSSVTLKAASRAIVKGHIEGTDDFNGTFNAVVRDTEETITCKLNDNTDSSGAETAFTYTDRPNTLYQGSDSVRASQFEFSFAVPKDINYSDGSGLITIHAVNTQRTLSAHGESDNFKISGSADITTDSIGPSIYCYLNTPSFVNGGNVNPTPYFVANITDEDGINATGTGIGHDMELIIDGQLARTYILNDNFQFDFGSYTSGSTWYNIPELDEGPHKLLFRCWDILNNSSTAELSFNVVKGLAPDFFSVGVTNNPATTTTTFIINHDRTGSELDVDIEVYDLAGRMMWNHSESGVSSGSAYTVQWDLTTSSGYPIHTGVYVYRVKIASDGSSKVSKAKKLIVLNNN